LLEGSVAGIPISGDGGRHLSRKLSAATSTIIEWQPTSFRTVIASVHQSLSGRQSSHANRTVHAGRADPEVGSPGYVVCLECGFRSRTPATSARRARPRACGVICPLEAAGRPPDHGAGLFGATLGDRQEARPRSRPRPAHGCKSSETPLAFAGTRPVGDVCAGGEKAARVRT
jgi:hypothetical protein